MKYRQKENIHSSYSKRVAKPFLKWAGGKGNQLSFFDRYFPIELIRGQINNYVEPFIGGGSIFFMLHKSIQ